MAQLAPGSDVHLEHTRISESHFERIKQAVADEEGRPHFGYLCLKKAEVEGSVDLAYARFAEEVDCWGMRTSSYLDLEGARLEKGIKASFIKAPMGVDFYRAKVGGSLNLEGSEIGSRIRVARCQIDGSFLLRGCRTDGDIECYEVKVSGHAYLSNMEAVENVSFRDSTFRSGVQFIYSKTTGGYFNVSGCDFTGLVEFEGLCVAEDFMWEGATFRDEVIFDKGDIAGLVEGACVFRSSVSFGRTIFRSPVMIRACASHVDFGGTRFESGATLLLRYATVRMTGATLGGPTSVIAASRTFVGMFGDVLDESVMSDSGERVKLLDIGSVDASNLTLVDVDLTNCRFAGAFNLDQLRLEGRWTFGAPPSGRIGFTPFGWAKRKVIEEERQWRALESHPKYLRNGWGDPPESMQPDPGVAALMTIYQQLRKGREDAKDEPGANDFYYGEMEMRRHGQNWGMGERWLRQAYWLLSGYGLRASRAFGWLGAAMIITILLMMGIGLPLNSPSQKVTGAIPRGGGEVSLEVDEEGLKNPSGDWFTGKRLEKALNVTLNSVVFRSSGQDLTTSGTYVEMVSRFSEPVLLGLGVLAIRGRLKRGS
ncbi:pentapeptide repeat-containing protein [Streptomyces kanamyceticus]|uniref:pentapeptide repeat-containing protein n=1 Tax=Streptomyces kanamyceticus TaxID=1967 RepID=UPI0012FF5216|nr:pentapeptide repeat-containing protein [Streptomyces kanamyceticus]